MNILLLDNGSAYTDKIVATIQPHNVHTLPFNTPIDESQSYDLIILSGGHVFDLLSQSDIYQNEINLVQTTDIPVLGICLGSEIITLAFGGEIKTLDRYERGVLSVNITSPNPLFCNISSPFAVYENHKNIITQLPKDFEILAESQDGIEIFKHKNKVIYGFQFHPEMFSDLALKNEIINNLMQIIKSR